MPAEGRYEQSGRARSQHQMKEGEHDEGAIGRQQRVQPVGGIERTHLGRREHRAAQRLVGVPGRPLTRREPFARILRVRQVVGAKVSRPALVVAAVIGQRRLGRKREPRQRHRETDRDQPEHAARVHGVPAATACTVTMSNRFTGTRSPAPGHARVRIRGLPNSVLRSRSTR